MASKGTVNKVILVGNLGRDPETRTFPSGGKICTLSLATTEAWKDRNSGETRERTEWHRVSIVNESLANLAERYLSKGSKVYVEGQLETRKWQDKNGIDRYSTEVVLRPYSGELTFLSPAGGGGGRGGYDSGNQDSGGYDTSQISHDGSGGGGDRSGGANASSSATRELDDEIPF